MLSDFLICEYFYDNESFCNYIYIAATFVYSFYLLFEFISVFESNAKLLLVASVFFDFLTRTLGQ